MNTSVWGLISSLVVPLTCYRYEGNGKTGPAASACSYVAPIEPMAIRPGLRLDYDVKITIGTLAEIRDRFQRYHNGTGAP